MKTALFIGRFQPFHDAHLEDIKIILAECDEVIIGIGSSQESNTRDNPFSYGERKEMIGQALLKNNINKFKIFDVPDFFDDGRWIGYIKQNLPKFGIVYSGNQVTIDCFSKKGYMTKKINLINGLNSTDIRNRIAEGEKWEHLVPKEVVEFIKENHGVKRIKSLYRGGQ